WALLGSFNWHRLVTCDAGHYEPGVFDVRAPRPRATALAGIVSALSRGEEPAHPVLAGAPWWRRADRLTCGSLVSSRTAERRASRGSAAPPQPTRAQPLLITGATGTLGRAFARVCAARGLAYRLVGRPEVDVTDARAVAAAIDRHAPWAVINTAGYVRVDSAESDVESCRRGNVVGPLTLAHACRRHGLPLVTFSSDLVFDGRKGAPYVESDPPSPLNVYGASKAEAEARVLDAHPGAMVVRTSSFFGPWDDYNFAVCAFRALDAGAVFPAPTDWTISPTYVPDLVHASLDLLIDGADGIWHLANDGALTWFEFACKAAVASGRSTDRIQPVDTSRVWSPAIRPRCTPLASDRARIMRPLESALQAFVDESRAAMAMED